MLRFALILTACACAATAQQDPQMRAWNQPVQPFRIAGNLYYVGASDLTVFLITTPQGHILIDTGLQETVPLVEAGIQELGFKLEDVKYLLNSHAHYDHCAGLSALKKKTGAKIVASGPDAEGLARGGRGDFAFGDKYPFPPVQADRKVKDGDEVRLGGVTVRAMITPGHTKGCTTWLVSVPADGHEYKTAVVCSVSAPGYQLVNNALYPNIVSDYEGTFRRLKALQPDIFLGGHGSFFGLTEKAEKARAGAQKNPFVDAAGYRQVLERSEAAFQRQLAEQRAKAQP